MQFFKIIVGAIVFFQFGEASEVEALAGGWSNADPKSSEVKAEAKFAVQKTYPGVAAEFKVVSAKKQVRGAVLHDFKLIILNYVSGCGWNELRFDGRCDNSR